MSVKLAFAGLAFTAAALPVVGQIAPVQPGSGVGKALGEGSVQVVLSVVVLALAAAVAYLAKRFFAAQEQRVADAQADRNEFGKIVADNSVALNKAAESHDRTAEALHRVSNVIEKCGGPKRDP